MIGGMARPVDRAGRSRAGRTGERRSRRPMKGHLAFLDAASFWRPRHFAASAWLQHAPFAFWLVSAMKPRTIVELGTHAGFSYFAFCQAVAAQNLPARCFAVDTWAGDVHAGFYGEGVRASVAACNAENYAGFSTLVQSTFDAALPAFAPGSIDLLHIDGRHFYEDVRHDFASWRDRLAPGAVVLFHDTAVTGRGFGVHRLFAELAQRHETFAFHHGNGLGVLGLDDRVPAAVRALFSAPPDIAAAVRASYQALGRAVEVEHSFRAGTPLGRGFLSARPSLLRRLRRGLRR